MGEGFVPSGPEEAQEQERQWYFAREAECALLGAVLLDSSAFDAVADLVRAEDFFLTSHRHIFAAMVRMEDLGRTVDMVSLDELLRTDRHYGEAGGMAYLAELLQSTPSARSARRHAEIVRDRSVLRRLWNASTEIGDAVKGYAGGGTRELLDAAQSRLMAVSESRRGAAEFSELQPVLSDVFAFVDQQHARVEAGALDDVTGVPFGFVDLDRETTGMHGGQLVIVAARPSMGKSAFAVDVAQAAARKTRRTALVFSLEMGKRELGLRVLAAASHVNVKRLVTGRLNNDEWDRIVRGVTALQDVPIAINESAGLSITELRAAARRAVRQYGGLSLIVVDYLQLMSGSHVSRDPNRVAEISEISRGLKNLAKELDVPVMALSQLNRAVEQRPNKRPLMSDLRESGSIEQDADVILMIYRDEVYNTDTQDRGMAEILIRKQRQGPTGTVRLAFRADMTSFGDLAEGPR